MFGLAARLVIGAVAGAGALVATGAGAQLVRAVKKEMEKERAMRSNECQLCGKQLSGIVRSVKCCDVRFHRDCLRAYVQSLDGCLLKCPASHCENIVILEPEERRQLEIPIPTETMYYCHICDSIVTNTRPCVLPCTHRFCVGCIRQCMMAKVAIMNEEPRCPMEGCNKAIPDELHDSIIRLEC